MRNRVVVFCLLVVAAFLASSASAAEWQPGVFYGVNALVTYLGPTYKCVQSHTSQAGYEPPNAPSLWSMQSRATATARARARATATPRPRVRATATHTATPTPRPSLVWRPGATFRQGDMVRFDSDMYRAMATHTSDASQIPPNTPALWMNLGSPRPRCQPKITVTVSTTTPVIGQSITVTAGGDVGVGHWSIQVLDGATGMVQDPNDPIFTPAQPSRIDNTIATASWILTAARAGRVSFRVSVNGEALIPPTCEWTAFTTLSALSPTVAAGGAPLDAPVLIRTNGRLTCAMELSAAGKLEWSAVDGATHYDIYFDTGNTPPLLPYGMGYDRTSFLYWDKARPGYFAVRPVRSGGVQSNQVQILFIPPVCPAPTPTARPRPTP
jgi:hypothetical protein